MNAPDPMGYGQGAVDSEETGRIATLSKVNLEEFQNLSKENLLLAQAIAGHGDEWGIWKTPKTICPSKLENHLRTIDIANRLRQFITNEPLPEVLADLIDELVEEGVQVFTRMALLLRLIPTSGIGRSRSQRLKPSTVANRLFNYWPIIFGLAIRRKAGKPETRGLLSCLTEDDVRELSKSRYGRTELERLHTLATRGCWADLPPHSGISETTDPSGPKPKAAPQVVPREYQPIHDRYLEAFGPRNLWVIREVGPRLLPLLEDLATYLEKLDWHGKSVHELKRVIVSQFIARHLEDHPWLDGMGRPLRPSFPLKTEALGKDESQFPPRNWSQLKVLSTTLQSAHLFLTLLATAGRSGEVETLQRLCVTTARDGKDYIRGWTYKLSVNLYGDARTWPAPTVLVQALGQQARLANVWVRLPPGSITEGLPKAAPAHNALWLSLGSSPRANPSEPLADPCGALQTLAVRIGMDPKPGGINLHPHRLRKTIGRLAGIALFSSPTALKRLFGHKCIEMTLHYILCNKDIQAEAEVVLRELRIMHCAETLEGVRDAITSGAPLPVHSGTAASRLADAVKEHETRLAASGRIWRDSSAYDLAYLLTARGKGWRFIQKDIICAKAPGEAGLCLKNRGDPNTSNCKSGCDNRIVLAVARRDANEIVQAYIDISVQALEEEQFEVFYYSMGQFLKELDNFPDIKEKYLADPQLAPLLATYKELDQ